MWITTRAWGTKNAAMASNPEDDVRGARFDRGSHVVGDDNDEDLREDEIEDAEFFAQGRAVGLDFGGSRFEGWVLSHCDGKEVRSRVSQGFGEKWDGSLFLLNNRFQQQILIVETEVG